MPIETTNGRLTTIQPSTEFLGIFEGLSKKDKETILIFLYDSLKSRLVNTEVHIIDGNPNRLKDIRSGKININMIPQYGSFNEQLQFFDNFGTDEQTLLRINSANKDFNYERRSWRDEKSDISAVFEHYINSSRIEKIAILQFLQNYDIGTSQSVVNIHNLATMKALPVY